MPRRLSPRLSFFVLAIALLSLTYAVLIYSGVTEHLANGDTLHQWLQTSAIPGPAIIIALMTLAVIMSPLPSAPIALAAGAAYGHTEGTVYVVIGAELGALGAFSIARLLGIDVLQKWFGGRLPKSKLGTQTSLMAAVFISRLLPFISFDMASYAAGLTSLSYARFAIATLAGIIPASFLLAHFGAEMASDSSRRITIALLLLAGFSALTWVLTLWKQRHSENK